MKIVTLAPKVGDGVELTLNDGSRRFGYVERIVGDYASIKGYVLNVDVRKYRTYNSDRIAQVNVIEVANNVKLSGGRRF